MHDHVYPLLKSNNNNERDMIIPHIVILIKINLICSIGLL